ncbi:MAG: trypsin-like peptidase domain-containing protein [Planctomycetia bacterium]|nr:trypsin-like peptidase domain-containing protein [Planctomycetia bacterium]
MLRLIARIGLLAGLVVFALPVSVSAQKPTKVEIAKRGKSATAFIEVPNRGTGTAFCIHPSGLFITNEHVVRGAEGSEITLVLNPSLENQRILKAKVIRTDKTSDFALLRVDGAKDLPSLPLGSVDGISELADVVACGFPLGKALSPDKKEYPAISVNAGSVTSLRYKDRKLQFFQIDISLTYGNSGGPVLDENGKVIGVVVSGVAGGKVGINQAIPVNHLESFLKTPDLSFTPPELTPATLDKPQQFKARVVSFVPNAPEPSVKLVLQVGDEKAREFPMKNVKGEWVATAVPAIKPTVSLLELNARIGSGSITGQVEDATFTVGGKSVKLSTVRRIEFSPKTIVTLADGKTLGGDVAGLGNVEIRLGEQKVKLDLTKSTQLDVRPPDEILSVSATVIATLDDKEVARVETRIPVRGAGATPGSPSVAIKPPTLAENKVVKQLPEVFSDVAVAGGGRYLIFQLPKLKKLAVFDVSEARITNYIPLAEEKAVFAAGLDAVIVGLPGAGRLERWSLTTFEREKNVSHVGEIRDLLMGHSATWAVIVDGLFLDPVTLKPLPLKYHGYNKSTPERAWVHQEFPLYASGDGTVYARWSANQSPTEGSTRVQEGSELKYFHGWNVTHMIPGPNGRWLYTGKGVMTREMKYANTDDEKYGYCLPATSGDYFFSLTSADDKGVGGTFTIYHRGMKGPIAKLDKADHGLRFEHWGREGLNGPWRRVFFIPDAKVIIVLPVSNDRVVMHKFDTDDALEKSGLDYLFVTSQPPRNVKPGTTFTYPLQVKSKHGGLTFKLDSGPKGMTVSATGVVTWAVPADATGDQEVILTVKDKTGQDVFHTFTVKVVK